MDNREANIDLIFRNGLKDFEVLPPPEVWDKIHPSIKPISKSFPYIRAAAVVTTLVTLSFLAYRLNRDIPDMADFPVVSMNIESSAPLFAPVANKPLATFKTVSKVHPVISQLTITEDVPVADVKPENDFTISSEGATIPEISGMTSAKNSLQHGPTYIPSLPAKHKTYEFVISDPSLMPSQNSIKNTQRWSIGAMASPTYYSTFSSEPTDLSRQLAASEQSLLSYSAGVSLSYKMNKRFTVQSGLYYSSLGQQVDGISSYGGFQRYVYTKSDHNFEVMTSSGPIYTNNPDVFLTSNDQGQRISTAYTKDVFDPEKVNLQYLNNTLTQNFSYLELPVVVRYKVIDKALDFNLIGGVSYNLLVKNSVYTTYGNQKYEVGETKGLNPLTLSSTLGVGMEYSFSNSLSLNLEPTFRYYLDPFDAVTGSQNHPYTFGIFTGLSYKF